MGSIRIKSLIIVAFLVLLLSSCGETNNSFFRGMNSLPKGKFINSYDSPTLNYTINIYLCDGGATTDFSIRGELVNNQNKSRKTIYWNYHEQEAYVEWIDEETVVINNHTLNVLEDVYDFRNE